MNQNVRSYEPPKMKIYQFDDNDLILTTSGGINQPEPTPNYAANALNELMNGTNTTIEQISERKGSYASDKRSYFEKCA